jgi:Uma2 family endonuclease
MSDDEVPIVREAAKKYVVSGPPRSDSRPELERVILRAEEELGLRLEVLVGLSNTSIEKLRESALKPVELSDERRENVEALIVGANEKLGLRLEMVGGLSIWEASPGVKHQLKTRSILKSIRPLSGDTKCDCIEIADLLIRFPNGSLKIPDISVFCILPGDADETGACSAVPEAVIEVLSFGSELKDLEIGPVFYLSQGVKDYLVLDAEIDRVMHHRQDGVREYRSPTEIELECGCMCTV